MGRKSRPKRFASAKDATLISLPIDPIEEIRASLWNSRGWTFQEALLSPRVLYFTGRQIFFHCQKPSLFAEITGMLPYLASDMTYRQASFAWPRASQDLCLFIQQYRLRNFTYEEDVLVGFLGILRRLEIGSNILHLYGCPFESDSVTEDIVNAISWEPGNTRRLGLPSWSWTGWKKLVEDTERMSGRLTSVDVSISFELKNGRLLSSEDLMTRISARAKHCSSGISARLDPLEYQQDISSYIHIEGWSARATINPNGHYGSLLVGRNTHDIGTLLFLLREDVSPGIYDTVFLGFRTSSNDAEYSYGVFLVLGSNDEKIGIARKYFPRNLSLNELRGWLESFCIRRTFRIG